MSIHCIFVRANEFVCSADQNQSLQPSQIASVDSCCQRCVKLLSLSSHTNSKYALMKAIHACLSVLAVCCVGDLSAALRCMH